jgi:S-ribosylhomocysteine lyase LuxS involved in autoinducer biosynthesis
LVRNADNDEVLAVLKQVLKQTIEHTGGVFGATQKECGNFGTLDLAAAQRECAAYLAVLNAKDHSFQYAA